MASSRERELSPMETENDVVVRAALVENNNPKIFQDPVMKQKTTMKPYVEVPKPLDMNFVQRPESKRAPRQLEVNEKHKSLDAKLLVLRKKKRWELAQECYSQMKQDKKNMQ